MILLLLYVGGALAVSFVCSLLEATLLSSRLIELNQRRDKGDRGATLLLEIKQERIDDAISAILTLNTVAHTVGAALAGAQAAELWPDTVMLGPVAVSPIGIFSAVLTLLILLLTEILPKTLGTVYGSHLVGFVAHTIQLLIRLLKPLILLTRFLTGFLVRRKEHTHISRSELAAMINLATREGTLHVDDSRVVSNILQQHEIHVEDVMTPRTVITMLPVTTTVGDLLADESARAFSRIPLYDGQRDNIVGYLLQREVLAAAARGVAATTPVTGFLRKALYLPEGQPVGKVMRRLIESREHMALVTDEYGGISGLVTLEDLVETLLGVEILDEYDRVVDMRAEAARLRERRLEGLRRLGALFEAPDGAAATSPPSSPDLSVQG